MKTFVIDFDTDYGLTVVIVNAMTEEEAKKLALDHGACDEDSIEELSRKPGVVFAKQFKTYLWNH